MHLGLLIERYWRPVYSFIRQFGNSHEDAKDLTQGFFTDFVDRDIVSHADRTRGRFRNFLIASVKRFLAMRYRAASRRPQHESLAGLDMAASEPSFVTRGGEEPERTFMRNWAKCVVENCLTRLRDECTAIGKEVRYLVLEARYLGGPGKPPSYAEIASRLGFSDNDVRIHLERAKIRLAALLREEVANTMVSQEDIDFEIAELVKHLA
ncbi:MAG: RNA polymerase sigma factor [Planctomycetota bacterium]|jgi:RNA polymerase sigma-70 factor (ECF subfamily)